MIFDLVPNLLSSVITILFPIFASFKALRTSDPAQLTPWLMYWIVFSCFGLFDYWTYFILSWVPLYAWIRLFVLSYLVLPQTQGAKLIYQTYVHPFLTRHEHDIEKFISSAHERAYAAGLGYVKRAVDLFKQYALGVQPSQERPQYPGAGYSSSAASFFRQQQASEQTGHANYAQSLLSRFNLPTARQGLAAPAGDFYGLLSSAMSVIGPSPSGAGERDAQVESLSRSGTLIPQGITSTSEKMTFLSTQRERLRVLLSALDKQASDLGTEAAIERDVNQRLDTTSRGDGLKKSKSEAEFEEIGCDEPEASHGGKSPGNPSWIPWGWSSGGSKTTGADVQ